jgi:hypothetical protein
MVKKKEEKKEESPTPKNVWDVLSLIDCNDFTEEKNGLTYLSWAWAWGVLKNKYPQAMFRKELFQDKFNKHVPFMQDEAGNSFVMVTVIVPEHSVDGEVIPEISSTELFPVLDYRNKGVQHPDAFEVNTAMQRALAKAIAYLGLGHYIYAGEDLPVPYTPNLLKIDVVSDSGKVKRGEGIDMIVAVFKEFINGIETSDALKSFWIKNAEAIKVLEKRDKSKYDSVVKYFQDKSNEIKKAEAETKEEA